MITLHLKNFRCWENHTFTFDTNGIILLSGISGKGKSTILNAILYVITGNLKNVTTFHKEKVNTEVRLTIDDIVITRGKNPTRFHVKKNDIIYELDEAQSIVDQLAGSEFKHVSYIDQDNQHSFVYLSPEGKMTFLRNLLLSNEPIEKLKSNIKSKMDENKKIIISEDTKMTMSSSYLSSMSLQKNELKLTKRVTITNYQDILDTQQTNLDTSKKNKLLLSSKLSTLEDRLKKFQEHATKLAKVKEIETELSSFEDLALLYQKMNALEEQKRIHESYKDYFDKKKRYDEQQVLLIEYREKRDRMDQTLFPHLSLLEKIVSIQETLFDLDSKIEMYNKDELEQLKLKYINDIKEITVSIEKQYVYKCPSCDTNLTLKDGHLHRVESISESTYKEIDLHHVQKKLDKVHKDLILLERNTDEYNKQFDTIESLLDQLKHTSITLESDIKPILSNCKKNEKSFQLLTMKISELEKETKRFEQIESPSHSVCVSDLYKIVEDITMYKESIKQIDQLNRKLVNITIEDITFDDPSVSIHDTKQKITEYEKKCETYLEHIEKLRQWKQQYDNNEKYRQLTETIEKSKNMKDYHMEELKCCETLLSYVKEAETRSIFDFIDTLNRHASLYIEDFFPDEDIQVELVTNKELKSGKDKIGLFFEVHYKNMKGDIDFLSGGQRDRINLAFTLAFSELVQNRLLLLDECISSLDSETSDTVIETLKEKYKGKLIICVAHQVNTGTFDKVIYLK